MEPLELVRLVVWSIVIGLTIILLAPLMDGIRRRIRARIQRRIGPPIMQTYYDLVKLFRIPPVLPSKNVLFVSIPYIVFVLTATVSLFIPLPGVESLSMYMDLLSLLYTLLLVAFFTIIAGLAIPNPYSNAGSIREALMITFFELFVALTITSIMVGNGTLNLGLLPSILGEPLHYLKLSTLFTALSLLVLGYVEGKYVPYDVAEAETEVLGGSMLEYSGRFYGLILYSLLCKRLILVSLFTSLFLVSPLIHLLSSIINGLLLGIVSYCLFIVFMFVTYIIYSVFDALNPRYRVDHLFKNFLVLSLIPLTGLILGWFGW